MICVCLNHHTMLDFFAIKLELNELLVINHIINIDFVHYYNQKLEHYNPVGCAAHVPRHCLLLSGPLLPARA
jgi:hypothetical protein